MNLTLPFRRSLKTRVTVVALTVFLLGVWSLTFYASRMLRRDLQDLLGEQQLSTAAIAAAQVDQELIERLHALELVASQITSTHLNTPRALQALLDGSPLLQELFNAGTYVAGTDGTAIASTPVELGRVGENYSDRDNVVTALTMDRSSVGEPVMGKRVKVPIISAAAPIHDAKGRVIGVLAGVVNLDQPNFLDLTLGRHYGKSGSYLLVDPRHRRIVTATDKHLNLNPMQSPGDSPIADRYAEGYEGHGLFVDSQGVEYLSAAHSVPTTGWYLAILLPVEEAFGPVRDLQFRVVGVAAMVSVLSALLIWWMLRREMAPLQSTAQTLAALPAVNQFPHALPVVHHDEIGRVVEGFNRLLDSLRARDVALRDSEAQLRDAQAIAGLGSYTLNGTTGLWTSSPALNALFGIDETYAHSIEGWIDLVHPEDRQRMGDYFAGLMRNQSRQFDTTYRIVRPRDGATRWMHGLGHLWFDDNGRLLKMNGSIQDITRTMQVQQRLSTLSRITEQAPIAIMITDLRGDIEYVNPYFEKITGYTFTDAVGNSPRLLHSGHTAPEIYVELWATLMAGNTWQGEFQNRKKNGDLFVERAVISPIQNADGIVTHYVALKEDISERKRSQLELQASLQEKIALLNEVHHRVKNNLQVISSLLRLEAGRASESVTRSVLGDMQGRIRSMALVHEILYRSGRFAAVDLSNYVQQVAIEAFRALADTGGGVRLVLNLAPVKVSLDQATTCGLLVNELISNSIKHGFPNGAEGEVRVELQPTERGDTLPERWFLRVRDNGVGLPGDFESRKNHSLGLQLVADLAGQLGGTLVIDKGQGVGFLVSFLVGAN